MQRSADKVVVVFRSRLRDGADLRTLESAGMRMYELASAMPGFLSYKDFAADDGEAVSIVEFTDMASLQAWRVHPEHLLIQQRARDEFMLEYSVQVCQPQREYAFRAPIGPEVVQGITPGAAAAASPANTAAAAGETGL